MLSPIFFIFFKPFSRTFHHTRFHHIRCKKNHIFSKNKSLLYFFEKAFENTILRVIQMGFSDNEIIYIYIGGNDK